MSEYTDTSDLWSDQCTLLAIYGLYKRHSCSLLKHLSTFSLALTLMHSVGSILFRSGSCIVAKAARPRDECRMSGYIGC